MITCFSACSSTNFFFYGDVTISFSYLNAQRRQIRLERTFRRLDKGSGGKLARAYSFASRAELVITPKYNGSSQLELVKQQRIRRLHSSIGLFRIFLTLRS